MQLREHGEAPADDEVRVVRHFSARFPYTAKSAERRVQLGAHITQCVDKATAFLLDQRNKAGILYRGIEADAEGQYFTLDSDLDDKTNEVVVDVAMTLLAPKHVSAESKKLTKRVFSAAPRVALKKRK